MQYQSRIFVQDQTDRSSLVDLADTDKDSARLSPYRILQIKMPIFGIVLSVLVIIDVHFYIIFHKPSELVKLILAGHFLNTFCERRNFLRD